MVDFSFLNEPYYFSMCLYVVGALSFPLHLFAAYCILFQSPATMKHVKWVMFNLHFWNSYLDLTISTFSQPFIIPPVFGGFFLGFFSKIGVNISLQVYIMVTLLMSKFLRYFVNKLNAAGSKTLQNSAESLQNAAES